MFNKTESKEILFRMISLITALIGLYVLLNSTELGSNETFEFINNVGGHVDSNDLNAHFISYTETYRLLGGILLGVGLYRLMQK